jgi:anti-anti-sigma factor
MSGRLDSLTAAEAQGALEELVAAGQRSLVVDLVELTYVSSAGLRVFLVVQKLLRKVGGRVIIFQAPEAVRQIFELSGFLKFFELASGQEELAALRQGEGAGPASRRLRVDGLDLELIERPGPPARLMTYGSQDKLGRAAYAEADMRAVPAGQHVFGIGLGCFGDSFEDCRGFFGEALIIDGSLFYQPAVPRAGVDFVLNLQARQGVDYKFLHAVTFNSPFQALVAFDSPGGPVDLHRLVAALHQVLPAPALGLALLAESRGLWGMSLKRSPVSENQPEQGREIFHPDLFQKWITFPVEPADVGHIFVGVGLAVAARGGAPAGVLPWLPVDADFHMHASVFGKGPLGKRPEQLPGELTRVISEMEALKVQHLLGRSQVTSGLAGLVALDVSGLEA